MTGVTSTSADPLDSLDVTVNIVDSDDEYLGLTLVSPSGVTLRSSIIGPYYWRHSRHGYWDQWRQRRCCE